MSSEGIQQVALVSGMCTAGGAYQPTMSDVAIITHRCVIVNQERVNIVMNSSLFLS